MESHWKKLKMVEDITFTMQRKNRGNPIVAKHNKSKLISVKNYTFLQSFILCDNAPDVVITWAILRLSKSILSYSCLLTNNGAQRSTFTLRIVRSCQGWWWWWVDCASSCTQIFVSISSITIEGKDKLDIGRFLAFLRLATILYIMACLYIEWKTQWDKLSLTICAVDGGMQSIYRYYQPLNIRVKDASCWLWQQAACCNL